MEEAVRNLVEISDGKTLRTKMAFTGLEHSMTFCGMIRLQQCAVKTSSFTSVLFYRSKRLEFAK
jgi:hypothetical protein